MNPLTKWSGHFEAVYIYIYTCTRGLSLISSLHSFIDSLEQAILGGPQILCICNHTGKHCMH